MVCAAGVGSFSPNIFFRFECETWLRFILLLFALLLFNGPSVGLLKALLKLTVHTPSSHTYPPPPTTTTTITTATYTGSTGPGQNR